MSAAEGTNFAYSGNGKQCYSKLGIGADGELVINNRKVSLSELRNRYDPCCQELIPAKWMSQRMFCCCIQLNLTQLSSAEHSPQKTRSGQLTQYRWELISKFSHKISISIVKPPLNTRANSNSVPGLRRRHPSISISTMRASWIQREIPSNVHFPLGQTFQSFTGRLQETLLRNLEDSNLKYNRNTAGTRKSKNILNLLQ